MTDKIGVLDAFLERADDVLIGGAMCFPFFKAQGHEVGALAVRGGGHRARPPRRCAAGGEQAAAARATSSPAASSPPTPRRSELDGVDVPDGWMGLDIGPEHRRSATPT